MALAHALQAHLDAFDRLLIGHAPGYEVERERAAALAKLDEIERFVARP